MINGICLDIKFYIRLLLIQEKKTATYTAVEKGHIPILKLLLNANPDLEVQTKVKYLSL